MKYGVKSASRLFQRLENRLILTLFVAAAMTATMTATMTAAMTTMMKEKDLVAGGQGCNHEKCEDENR